MRTTHEKRSWRISVLVVALGVWIGGGAAVLGAGYQMEIAFTGYSNRVETLTNFPVLVVLSNNVGGASSFNFNGFVTTNGYDLRFVSSLADSGSLNYEIESWNTNAGKASYVWVQVPRIPRDGTGAIWARWGDTANSNQLACTTNGAVWTNHFAAVWHLSEASGTRLDATTNGNNGTPLGGVAATSSGFVAGANSFDGAARPNSDYVETTPMSSTFQSTSPRTVSAWIYTDQTQNGTVIAKNDNASSAAKFSWTLRSPSNQKPVFQVQSGGSDYWNHTASNACVPPNTWVRLTAVLTSFSPRNIDLYVNGVEVPSTQASGGTPPASWPSANTNVWIGKEEFSGSANAFKGVIDEVRIANADLSSDWIWAEYVNMASNTTFGAYRAVQPAGGSPQSMRIALAGYTNRTETLTNFPVLVVLSNNVGGGRFNYSHFVSPNGYDLRFAATSTGTDWLNYEIESWNPSIGQASYVWVQVPTIPGDGSGAIWAKWGDTAHSNQLACTTNGATWSNAYVGVWHMGVTNASGKIPDSVAVPTHGVNYNTTLHSGGKVGAARDFNGTTAAIDITGISKAAGSLTVEYWLRTSTNKPAMMPTDWQTGRLITSVNHPLTGNANYNDPGGWKAGAGSGLNDDAWRHLTFSLQSANGCIYIDGAPANSGMPYTDTAIGGQAAIGSRYSRTDNYFFVGQLDEVRISGVARSSNWVWACYQTMASNTAFSAYGAVEAPVAGFPEIINGVAMNILNASAALSGTLVTNGSSSTWVTLFCATNDYTTNEANWVANSAASTNFGPFTSGAAFTNTLTGLGSNTWYYWNHMASNAAGKAWGATAGSPSFKTFGPPVVNNSTGATAIGIWSATLNGVLTNGAPAHVFVHLWADGSVTTNIYELGSRSLGGFSTNVSGLSSFTAYSYQCFGSNAYGTAWAAAASNFTTMAALTTGTVTWSGAAGGGNRNWNEAANWLENLAPTNPTAATIYFKTNGQAVVGLLEADRQIGGVYFDSGANGSNIAHTVDLGGRILTLAGNLTGADSRHWSFRLTNGTLRLGTTATAANLTVGRLADGTLTMSPGTILDTVNLGSVSLGEHTSSGNGDALLDLRGCQVSNGVLRMRSLSLVGYYKSAFVYLDGNTGISSIEVSNTVSLGASYGPGAYSGDSTYVGNPSDSGNLPANISLKIGSSPAQRGDLIVNRLTSSSYLGNRTDKLVASSGGTFTAYLSNLWVAANGVNPGSSAQYGILDISRMNSCIVDALDVRLGVPASAQSTDNLKGEWRVCSGTVTAGTVVVGATVGTGYGLLALSNTLFTVTNTLTINTTGTNLVSVGAEPSGFDVQGTFTDGGGRILVSFLAAPTVGTNWAIRIKGDAQSTLNAMIGASPSRLTSTGTYPNKKAGVLYDAAAGYTYYAMADSNAFATLPVAVAHDERTYELAPAGTVVIGTNDINNGSSDPNSRPLTMTLYTNGGVESATLTFDTAGDYGVTLKVTANSDSATDTCTVRVVAVNPGVTNALTWKGGASTPLMDRREWMWSANWVEGVPPTNPTPATIYYKTEGQSVTGRLEQSRTVGGLLFDSLSGVASITHALDLGGNVLTVAGSMDSESSRNWTMRMTNGTLRLGSVSQPASLRVGRLGAATLALAPGMVLDPVNLATVSLGEHTSSGSGLCVLDVRGCTVSGGVLGLRDLTVTSYNSDGYLALDGGTALGSIVVSNTLSLGQSIGGGNTYIGNPSDGKLPANVGIQVGTDAARRGNLYITRLSTFTGARTDKLVATSGGTFTAYLTNLWISANHGVNNSAALYGLLDIAKMNACNLDIQSLLLAPDRAPGPLATDNYRGELRLGPGAVTLGTGVIGANTNAGFGLLALSNTTVTVTDTLVVNRSGRVEIDVGSQSCGLMISNAADTAFSMATATNGALRISFRAPFAVQPHYGLAWIGDHVQALQDMQADGRLVLDSTGVAPKTASVFMFDDVTCVGVHWPSGSVFRFR